MEVTYSLAMTTVCRPYRHETFMRLVESGTLEHPNVRGFHVAYDRIPNENADHVLGQALMDKTDWILLMEDDIDIIDDFIGSADRWIRDHAQPNIHMYPLGCGVRRAYFRARDAGVSCWEWPLKEFFGATAVLLRPSFVEGFREVYAMNPDWFVVGTGLDENLKRYHQRVSDSPVIRTPIPCFIDHRGTITSQTTAAPHWTGSYLGWTGRHARYRSTLSASDDQMASV